MTDRIDEITPPIEMPPLPPEPEPAQEDEPEVPVAKAEDSKERNYRELRLAKEAAEKERDEMRRVLQEMKEAQKAPASDEPELHPDDIPEWRHVQKHIKNLENKLSHYEKQSVEQNAQARLRAQYPDFDAVVTADHIEALRSKYPELATTIGSTQDLYSKAVSAYTMIKRLGIIPDETFNPDKEKALKNAQKPRPLASVSPQQGESPLSRANAFAEGLTDELREQLRKEMLEAIKYR